MQELSAGFKTVSLIPGVLIKSNALHEFCQKGVIVPYDEEPERKPTVKKLNANKFNTIFAVEGGAALHVKNESIHRLLCLKRTKALIW